MRAVEGKTSMAAGAIWSLLAVVGLMATIWTGCSSTPPAGPAQPTTQQIRGDSDRFFDKMKQEEKERAAQPK